MVAKFGLLMTGQEFSVMLEASKIIRVGRKGSDVIEIGSSGIASFVQDLGVEEASPGVRIGGGTERSLQDVTDLFDAGIEGNVNVLAAQLPSEDFSASEIDQQFSVVRHTRKTPLEGFSCFGELALDVGQWFLLAVGGGGTTHVITSRRIVHQSTMFDNDVDVDEIRGVKRMIGGFGNALHGIVMPFQSSQDGKAAKQQRADAVRAIGKDVHAQNVAQCRGRQRGALDEATGHIELFLQNWVDDMLPAVLGVIFGGVAKEPVGKGHHQREIRRQEGDAKDPHLFLELLTKDVFHDAGQGFD